MTQIEQKAFDDGFMLAATMRAEVAVLTGEASMEDYDAESRALAETRLELRQANEQIADLRNQVEQRDAGFRPYQQMASGPGRMFWIVALCGLGLVWVGYLIGRAGA
jgi:hypothetical protein